MRIRFSFSLAALLAVCLTGCTDSTSTTSPSPETTTEVFAGTVVQSGATAFPFSVATVGPLTIALTSVAPLSTMSLGVGIGAWDGTACTLIASSRNENARAGVAAVAGQASVGTFCVDVYDSGNIPADWSVDFTVQVTHS